MSVLIVGGGPAGSAAAIMLARAGIPTRLVERSTGPHDVVCGGFCGWDALAALRRLGIDPNALGARPITTLRLVANGRRVERALPKPAAGLSRRTLDAALLAAANGVEITRGVTARAEPDGSLRLGEERVRPERLVLATGKYDLKGLGRDVPASRGEGAVGLRTAFQPSAAVAMDLEGVVELHPFDRGYAGLLVQEDGAVNLCFSVAAARLREVGGVPALLETLAREAPAFGARLAHVDAPWISVSNVPYGWRALATTPGLYRVGDQASVIASLAGDGIAIALASGMAAAEAVIAGEGAEAFQRGWAKRARRPVAVAERLRHAAEGRMRGAMLGLARLPGAAGLAARLTRIG